VTPSDSHLVVGWDAGQWQARRAPDRQADGAAWDTAVQVADSWGALPWLGLVSAIGVLLVAYANNSGRVLSDWAEPLLWAGLITMYVPTAVRLAWPGTPRHERIGLVSILGLGLFLAKLMYSPLYFTFHDEFAHWQTADTIVSTGRLFEENTLIPVSTFYPGLEIVTAAVVSVSGLSIFSAGVLVLGVTRIMFMVALYLLHEAVSGSGRVAGIATLLYMANPNFAFFDSQFGYESLALPLAGVILFAVVYRTSMPRLRRLGPTVIVLLGLAALVTTHHLTAQALTAFLVCWAAVAIVARTRDDGAGALTWTALLALVLILTWLAYVAAMTLAYLAPNFTGAFAELVRLVMRESTSRELFRASADLALPPLWERVTAFSSVILILLGLPVGLLAVWRGYRRSGIALTFGLIAATYPGTLALRLTQAGAESSNRSSELIFLAIGFVLAVAVVRWGLGGRKSLVRTGIFGVWATMIFLGGTIIGWGHYGRLPGAYLVSADQQSIEPQGVLAAQWARDVLGPSNRMAADRTNRLLMATYGGQRLVTGAYDAIDVAPIFMSPEIGDTERALLHEGNIRFIVVDKRLTTALPVTGVYFEAGEPDTNAHTSPLDPDALAKFDHLKQVNRVFDSGDIMVYDVTVLRQGGGE